MTTIRLPTTTTKGRRGGGNSVLTVATTTATTVAAAALVCLLLLGLPSVSAETVTAGSGPISLEQCSIINPNPVITNCATDYPQPAASYYAGLPYATVPAYQACVAARCACTYYIDEGDTLPTPDSIFCGVGATAYLENGTTTCNEMSACFGDFFTCVTDALVARRLEDPTQLTAAENTMMDAIIAYGTTPGGAYADTDLYLDCQLQMCQAAAGRQNCGLQTCIPHYKKACTAYMRPPPLPFRRYKCTQGCQAGLLLMALTLAVAGACAACCVCCPAVVKEKPPVVDKSAKGSSSASGKKEGGSDSGSNKKNENNSTSTVSSASGDDGKKQQ